MIAGTLSKGRHADNEYRPTPSPHDEWQGSIVVECIGTPEAANTIQNISCEFIYG